MQSHYFLIAVMQYQNSNYSRRLNKQNFLCRKSSLNLPSFPKSNSNAWSYSHTKMWSPWLVKLSTSNLFSRKCYLDFKNSSRNGEFDSRMGSSFRIVPQDYQRSNASKWSCNLQKKPKSAYFCKVSLATLQSNQNNNKNVNIPSSLVTLGRRKTVVLALLGWPWGRQNQILCKQSFKMRPNNPNGF